ncbi:LPS export ABC transporter periplasmic protein LptC [Alishewanella sp. SMS8]|uniref:LPS export ABC transporter periplasmic protein LptC n=1 Tax=unclassified Alishewanella TaxID=2628974 RepID=UPI002740D032|nr:LPS export ABC transporter periplasmic protein LptC [Alishewanella sp. SMS8]MDP4944371.1 LPS export ABC transporter periplasmic protein LptC [Alishewanella sp.]MDP5205665.1 LPS export ABC transporter periplasmic protein LptC [Alishewanella sp. SMS9]MDP5036312.1 LPS export ABC transporter periplasmic protein LptC [Alishewanella sp.]MDP5188244.1 LPS export ABC transporter periplasmic protein LptC [Alishewanella sp.]MDP5458846.1 LPS export ABC transporter periplasmic protein LptC [Alishewanell
MRKFFVLIVMLLVIVAGYLWLNPSVEQVDLQVDREFQPDYIAENVTLRIYDNEGYIADHVQALKLEHFEQLGFTQFDQPRYTLFNKAHQPAWEISSLQGVWFPEDKIILENQVVLQNKQTLGLVERVETASLQLMLPEKSIHTHEIVQITGAGFFIKGQGMHVDLTKETIQLQKHLETVYFNEN